MKWIVFEIEGKVSYKLDGSEGIAVSEILEAIREVGVAGIKTATVVTTEAVGGPKLQLEEKG